MALVLSSIQRRVDYDSSSNPIYIAQAAQGVSSATSSWTIWKVTYASGEVQSVAIAVGAWDSRTSLTYT